MQQRKTNHPRAFTLIEVMISMGLVLGLILGINAVFKMAADTVGTGQALSAKMRDSRSAQTVFFNDISHAVLSGDRIPFLVIDSRTQAAFRDARDKEDDRDFNPADTPANQDYQIRTIDVDGNNNEGEQTIFGERISPAAVNDRAHRLDTLSFCARDLYRRQTGNYGTYVADMAGSEGWITYGHGRVFDQQYDAANANIDDPLHYPLPGALPTGANPNPKNYYANDWVLLRSVMVLAPPAPPAGSPPGTYPTVILDHPGGTSQAFWFKQNTPALALQQLQPLGRQTVVLDPTGNTPPATVITDARFDLAGTTTSDFRTDLTTYVEHTNYHLQGATPTNPPLADAWWDILASGPRFRCNPYPQKPMDSRKVAQTASILMSNCSQFIVEYAGDYVSQNTDPTNANYGDITGIGPDGTIDFFVERVSVPINPPNPIPATTTLVQRTRWYGYPRDANGDGIIRGWDNTLSGVAAHNQLVDVVPLRDVVLTVNPNYYNGITNVANKAFWDRVRFERGVFNDGTLTDSIPPKANYADMTNPANSVQPGNRYVAAWSPGDSTITTATGTYSLTPKMIRLIIRTEDPNGKLTEGHTSEFVIKLP